MSGVASSELIAAIKAKPPRSTPAQATGHMRERLAAALWGSRPSMLKKYPDEAYFFFLTQPPNMRALFERQADDLLRCCDFLKLEIVDAATGEERWEPRLNNPVGEQERRE